MQLEQKGKLQMKVGERLASLAHWSARSEGSGISCCTRSACLAEASQELCSEPPRLPLLRLFVYMCFGRPVLHGAGGGARQRLRAPAEAIGPEAAAVTSLAVDPQDPMARKKHMMVKSGAVPHCGAMACRWLMYHAAVIGGHATAGKQK